VVLAKEKNIESSLLVVFQSKWKCALWKYWN